MDIWDQPNLPLGFQAPWVTRTSVPPAADGPAVETEAGHRLKFPHYVPDQYVNRKVVPGAEAYVIWRKK